MSSHLTQAKHSVLTTKAVVMGLLARVLTRIWLSTGLRRSEFFKSSRHDGIGFLMLPPMSHHFIGIRAHEVALEAMEMRCFVLAGGCKMFKNNSN